MKKIIIFLLSFLTLSFSLFFTANIVHADGSMEIVVNSPAGATNIVPTDISAWQSPIDWSMTGQLNGNFTMDITGPTLAPVIVKINYATAVDYYGNCLNPQDIYVPITQIVNSPFPTISLTGQLSYYGCSNSVDNIRKCVNVSWADYNGVCGTAPTTPSNHAVYAYDGNTNTFSGAQLCSVGSAYPASQTLPATSGSSLTWTCASKNGVGSNATCTAIRATPGVCGTASTTPSNHAIYAYDGNTNTFSGAQLCSVTGAMPTDKTLAAAGSSSISWTCTGQNTGASANCTATRAVASPINGGCGTANNKTYTYYETFPGTYTYCSTAGGTNPTTPTNPPVGSSSSWTCLGLSGGSSSTSCRATRASNICGNGIKEYPPENCDTGISPFDGIAGFPSAFGANNECNSNQVCENCTCQVPICGNGIIDRSRNCVPERGIDYMEYSTDSLARANPGGYVSSDAIRTYNPVTEQPVMTSNNDPFPNVVIGNSEASGHEAWKAFDGDSTTTWWQNTATNGKGSLTFDYGNNNKKIVTKFDITSGGGDVGFAPKDYILYGSNDNINWDILLRETNQTWATPWQTQSFIFGTPTAPYRYYKLDVTDVNYPTTNPFALRHVEVGEIKLWTGATSDTNASESSYNKTIYLAWKAFNQTNLNSSDAWISKAAPTPATPQWIEYDFGNGNAKTITQYIIINRNDSNSLISSPNTWRFQGSNDVNGTVWDDLDGDALHPIVDTNNIQSAVRTFNFNNSNAYRYYRIYITARNGTLTYVSIGELELFETANEGNLQVWSEPTIKNQGSYSLKGVALTTGSLTKTLSPAIDLTNVNQLKFDLNTSVADNIKVGLYSGGTKKAEITPSTTANAWQTVTWPISGITTIDKIVITVVNNTATTFYIDNFIIPISCDLEACDTGISPFNGIAGFPGTANAGGCTGGKQCITGCTCGVNNSAPTASSLVATPNYCGNATMSFNWTYNDTDVQADGSIGDPSYGYDIEVNTHSDFTGTPDFSYHSSVTGDIAGSTQGTYTNVKTPTLIGGVPTMAIGDLSYATPYYWRVRVFDATHTNNTNWTNGAQFTTPTHPYPSPSFATVTSPLTLTANQAIATFTDSSTCWTKPSTLYVSYPCSCYDSTTGIKDGNTVCAGSTTHDTYTWWFKNTYAAGTQNWLDYINNSGSPHESTLPIPITSDTPPAINPPTVIPSNNYNSPGQYYPILKVCDEVPYCCPATGSIVIKSPSTTPLWYEISPLQ